MSWKDIKIAKKLYIGFGAVLALTMAVGYVAYNGLDTVGQKVVIADDANRLIKWAKDCRQHEKNFIMRGDKKYQQENDSTIEGINQQISETKASLKDQADIATLETAQGLGKEYKAAFDGWVSLWDKQQIQEEVMVNSARAFVAVCEEMLEDQTTKLMALLDKADVSQEVLDRIQKTNDANQLVKWTKDCRQQEKNFIMRGGKKYQEQIDKTMAEILTLAEDMKTRFKDPKNWERTDRLVKAGNEYKAAFDNWVGLRDQQLVEEDTMVASAREFVKTFDDFRAGQKEDMEGAQSSAITLAISFIIGALIIGILVAFTIARGISKPVSNMAEVASGIAQGDIDHSIDLRSKDEIGALAEAFRSLIDYMQEMARGAEKIADNDLRIAIEPKSEQDVLGNSFKRMVNNLDSMIRQLRDNATELVSAATEIASASEEMAAGVKNQTDQAAQVSSAIEEMTATIVQSAKNANEAKEVSENASGTSGEGQKIVGDTIDGMVKIADSAQDSGKIVNELAQASDKIGEIIAVIDDIADQTNLLALNAAIEAARAGEQGRGFAVVADEVRKLAERTGRATGEITDMIKGIQNDSNRAVASMEEAGKLVEEGKAMADKAGNSLNEINTMSQRVTDMIVQIATASDQQSAAAEQISRNMENISNVTKETATGAEQSASAAEELNRQAEGLKQMVGQFKVKENA
jgi:methyl-accepting chemotaxis protein